jgi:SAM-dependent methyltransferase
MRRRALLSLGALAAAGLSSSSLAQPRESAGLPEVPFVPTPMPVVERMMKMAAVGPNDLVYDLGCGDGRIVIEAAKLGARAYGVDLDNYMIELGRRRARENSLEHLARFEQKDIYEIDFSPATVVTMYLLPEHNLRLRDRLRRQLKSGSRILSHDWDMGDWTPVETAIVDAPDKPVGIDKKSRVMMWRV